MKTTRYEIRNIRRGTGRRAQYVYAELYLQDEMIIAATLDYIVERLDQLTEEDEL
jgi:hypothetical protein